MLRKSLVTFAAIAAFAAPLSAAGGDIVVEGKLPIGRDAAREMVSAITRPVDGQIARFHAPICPSVVGMGDDLNRRAEVRLRQVAAAVGARVDATDCQPNLIVFVSGDVRQQFSYLKRQARPWFVGLNRYQMNQLEKSDGPVLAWSATQMRNADGEILRTEVNPLEPSGMKVRSTSFVKPVGKQVIDGSVVIIDREALDQRPLWQIADYIAMRALTPTLVPESNTTPTVLRAFSLPAGEGPQTLTAADLAFLRSVYSHDGLMSAVAERPRLASEMAKEG